MEVLSDFSKAALSQAIKGNLYTFFRFMCRGTEMELAEESGLARYFSGVPHPWFNGILCSRPPKIDETFIQNSIEYFQTKGVSTFTLWLEPNVEQANWDSILKTYDFQYSDDAPGMAVDLEKLNGEIQPVEGLEIIPIEDQYMLDVWNDTFIKGYGLPDFFTDSMRTLMQAIGTDLPIRNYLGLLDGSPVATSNIFFGAGVAGIMFVGTHPSFRGIGIGTWMTLKPLLDARQLGFRIGILQSSEMGYSVYKQLGFEHICQMEHYYRTLQIP